MKQQYQYHCAECGGRNVQSLEWINPNTKTIAVGDPYAQIDCRNHNYCLDCGCNTHLAWLPVVPAPPKLPVTGQQFADYIWELTCILNNNPEIAAKPKNGEVDLMQKFASFFSCAAEDGLWDEVEGGLIAINDEDEPLDTPGGLMQGLFDYVCRERE